MNAHDPVASAKQLAAAQAPQGLGALPPAPASTSSASSYSSVTTESTPQGPAQALDNARITLLEESLKAQTEVLQKLATDVAQLVAAPGAESTSVAQRRATSRLAD